MERAFKGSKELSVLATNIDFRLTAVFTCFSSMILFISSWYTGTLNPLNPAPDGPPTAVPAMTPWGRTGEPAMGARSAEMQQLRDRRSGRTCSAQIGAVDLVDLFVPPFQFGGPGVTNGDHLLRIWLKPYPREVFHSPSCRPSHMNHYTHYRVLVLVSQPLLLYSHSISPYNHPQDRSSWCLNLSW